MEKIQDIDKLNNYAIEALDAVFGDREADYDHPVRDFIGTAIMWTAYLRRKLVPDEVITPLDFPMMMTMVKLSRQSHVHKDDNCVDMIGYIITYQRVKTYLDFHGLDENDLQAILRRVQNDVMNDSVQKIMESK